MTQKQIILKILAYYDLKQQEGILTEKEIHRATFLNLQLCKL